MPTDPVSPREAAITAALAMYEAEAAAAGRNHQRRVDASFDQLHDDLEAARQAHVKSMAEIDRDYPQEATP